MLYNYTIEIALKDFFKSQEHEFKLYIDCVEEYEQNEEFRNKINDLYNLHNEPS